MVDANLIQECVLLVKMDSMGRFVINSAPLPASIIVAFRTELATIAPIQICMENTATYSAMTFVLIANVKGGQARVICNVVTVVKRVIQSQANVVNVCKVMETIANIIAVVNVVTWNAIIHRGSVLHVMMVTLVHFVIVRATLPVRQLVAI